MALINKLNNIGDAIRAKTGKEDKLTLEQMVTEIAAIETGGSKPAVIEALVVTENGIYTPSEGVDGFNPVTVNVPTGGGGDLPEEAFVLTGDCGYRFANNGWDWFIENYGNQITSKDIIDMSSMFYDCNLLDEIPFELNGKKGKNVYCDSMFNGCAKLTSIPKINCEVSTMVSLFQDCKNLRELSMDDLSGFDFNTSDMDANTSGAYKGNRAKAFQGCFSLRSFPMEFLNHGNPYSVYSSSIYSYEFYNCYSLDEIIDLPFPHYNSTWTSNAFAYGFDACYRLKNMTFALQEDGTPYTMNWKSQTIDLSKNVGYLPITQSTSNIINYNSGITADKMVTDDASYQALKDDPDWFGRVAYSRYNHDSAVATINSLPDTSAYLASAGGTNTIKFTGAAGSKTDGGAINTLTEEEIAVATAKGWTVTLV